MPSRPYCAFDGCTIVYSVTSRPVWKRNTVTSRPVWKRNTSCQGAGVHAITSILRLRWVHHSVLCDIASGMEEKHCDIASGMEEKHFVSRCGRPCHHVHTAPSMGAP